VFNETDTSSKIFFRVKNKELMFIPNGETSQSVLKLSYFLYNTRKNNLLTDSGTYYYHFKNNNSEFITNEISVNTSDTAIFFVEVKLTDVNQNITSVKYLTINRKDKINSNDALIANLKNEPYFLPLSANVDTFKIIFRKNLPKKWNVSWFPNKYVLRPSPYSIGNYNKFTPIKPDSTRIIYLTDTNIFIPKSECVTHFYQDTLKNGFSVISFSNNFPEITTPQNLLQPLRMLTTQKEFNDMNLLANKKESVDKFWLNAGGNVNRASELIRVFYTRVMLANKYFTSYTEGWKTDRGLIYIVFGLPVTIYKSSNVERWIYGTSLSNKTLVFNFINQQNPFSNNDYTLNREEIYKISWTQAVETWRNGRVYSVAY